MVLTPENEGLPLSSVADVYAQIMMILYERGPRLANYSRPNKYIWIEASLTGIRARAYPRSR